MGGDTIAAIATAPGKAGVAVVRVSGPDAFAIVERLTGRLPEAGRFFYHDHQVILGFKAPRSYTGEDVVEFQTYGGAIVPRQLLERIILAGARLARRGEFTERAFMNGKLDYEQAEAVLNLINAKTEGAAETALKGLNGEGGRERRALYDAALALSAAVEHLLDVSENEIPPEYAQQLNAQIAELTDKVAQTIASAKRRRIMRDGVLVVLAGAPNAGKSSLMNALLRENRAIVSEVPGTTRDSIEAWLDLDGVPVRLVDTAGLRDADDRIEAEGVRRAEALIASAPIVIRLRGAVEAQAEPDERTIDVIAKCDLRRGEGLNVSALTGEGMEALKAEIKRRIANLDWREALDGVDSLIAASEALQSIAAADGDWVLTANALRSASEHLGALIGAVYSEDILTKLFSQFCVGK